MKRKIAGIAALVASTTAIAAFTTQAGAESSSTPELNVEAQNRCLAMQGVEVRPGLTIGQARYVPFAPADSVVVDNGQTVPVPIPAHCVLTGTIDPYEGVDGKPYGIGFELALPDEWNHRFLLQGGGGLNGTVRPAFGPVASGDRPALTRGFAVMSHDSGHEGAVFDPSFMTDQRAALNFAEASVKTAALEGKAMTQLYYGDDIGHSYMTGCSTGGREGMLAMQRYPELFDGIIVGAPAMRTGDSNLAIEYSNVMFNRAAPKDADGVPIISQIFSDADRKTILDGMLKQCDALDGASDGMIMDVAQCKVDPKKMQCKAGEKDGCLSGAQVEALELAFAGPKDAAGYDVYAPVPWDTGIVDKTTRIPGYLPVGGPGIFGPAPTATSIDIDAKVHELDYNAAQRLTDTHVWTDLDRFLARGGKTLFFHGVSDPWFSAWATWDYWQRAAQTNGDMFTDASRFYMVPGMSHCSGGNAFDKFDLLTPLVDWVENGNAPGKLVSKRSDGSAERPLCEHPAYAHYDGGDPAKAESYSCKLPSEGA